MLKKKAFNSFFLKLKFNLKIKGEKKDKIFDVEIKKSKKRDDTDVQLSKIQMLQLLFTNNQKIKYVKDE